MESVLRKKEKLKNSKIYCSNISALFAWCVCVCVCVRGDTCCSELGVCCVMSKENFLSLMAIISPPHKNNQLLSREKCSAVKCKFDGNSTETIC